MSLISPVELELRYLRFEKKFYEKLSSNFKKNSFLMFLLMTFVILISTLLLNSKDQYILINGFKNFYFFNFFTYFLLPISLCFIYIKKKYQLPLLILFSASTWLVFCYFIFRTYENTISNFEIAISVPIVILFGLIYLKLSEIQRIRKLSLFAYSILFSLFYFYIFQNRSNFSQNALSFFWELKLPFLFIFICSLPYYFSSNFYESTRLIFNPSHLSRGVLWPSNTSFVDEIKEKQCLWMNGTSNLALGFCLLCFKMYIEINLPMSEFNVPIRTATIQILRILTDVGIFNIITGTARTLGYRVPDATSFVFLAKTPAEFWRRGSVYTYQFILRTIYLPLIGFFKVRSFAVFVSFLFFFCTRIGFERFSLSISNLELDRTFKIDSFIFLGFFTCIIVTQKYWFFSREKLQDPFWAWLSILLTHTINISVVITVRYIFRN